MKVNPNSDLVTVRALFDSANKADRVQLLSFDTPALAAAYVNQQQESNPEFRGAVTRQRGKLLDITT